jgi:hypothetical protein
MSHEEAKDTENSSRLEHTYWLETTKFKQNRSIAMHKINGKKDWQLAVFTEDTFSQ